MKNLRLKQKSGIFARTINIFKPVETINIFKPVETINIFKPVEIILSEHL